MLTLDVDGPRSDSISDFIPGEVLSLIYIYIQRGVTHNCGLWDYQNLLQRRSSSSPAVPAGEVAKSWLYVVTRVAN